MTRLSPDHPSAVRARARACASYDYREGPGYRAQGMPAAAARDAYVERWQELADQQQRAA